MMVVSSELANKLSNSALHILVPPLLHGVSSNITTIRTVNIQDYKAEMVVSLAVAWNGHG